LLNPSPLQRSMRSDVFGSRAGALILSYFHQSKVTTKRQRFALEWFHRVRLI
jgi:hypothetical protein